MTSEERAMAILERADPVPPSDTVDVQSSAPRYLEDLHQRSSTVTVQPTESTPTRGSMTTLAIAASIVAIVVASIALIVATRDDAAVVDDPDPTVPDIATALSVMDAFTTAFNSGDTDAVAATIAEDAVVSTDDDDLYDQAVHHHGTGTVWRDPLCTPEGDEQPDSTSLRCRWDVLDHLVQAVDGEPWEMVALVVVVDGEITELQMNWGTPDWSALGRPWSTWMDTYHPGVLHVIEGPAIAEELPKLAQLEAQWADEWGIWLDEWSCEPTALCSLERAEWVAEYDARCNALEFPGTVTPEFAAQVRLLPRAAILDSVGSLIAVDQGLVQPELTDVRIAELQRQRRELMIELGIDERCHPSLA